MTADLQVKFSHLQFLSPIRQEFEEEQDGIHFSWLTWPLGLLAPGSNQGFGWCVLISLASGHVIDSCLGWLQPLHKHPMIRPLPVLFPSEDIILRTNYPYWHRLSPEMVLSKWYCPVLSHITSAPRLVLEYMNFEILGWNCTAEQQRHPGISRLVVLLSRFSSSILAVVTSSGPTPQSSPLLHSLPTRQNPKDPSSEQPLLSEVLLSR